MTQTGRNEILRGQFPLGNSGGNERLSVPGAVGNSSHLPRYSQSVQVHHHHLCHQGVHLDPKKEGKRNKEMFLGVNGAEQRKCQGSWHSSVQFQHSRTRQLSETNTYSWARLSRRTRVTRETNGTLQRENIPSQRCFTWRAPVTAWGGHPTESNPNSYKHNPTPHPIFADAAFSPCPSQSRSAS